MLLRGRDDIARPHARVARPLAPRNRKTALRRFLCCGGRTYPRDLKVMHFQLRLSPPLTLGVEFVGWTIPFPSSKRRWGICRLVSTPAYAKATAGKPSLFFRTRSACLQSEALAEGWLGICQFPIRKKVQPNLQE